jgi:hypothetical protein
MGGEGEEKKEVVARMPLRSSKRGCFSLEDFIFCLRRLAVLAQDSADVDYTHINTKAK